MSSNFKISLFAILAMAVIVAGISLTGCKAPNVPLNTNNLATFHQITTPIDHQPDLSNQLALFVDYSNCISDGMHSPFYQKLVPALTAATKEYWSIKGDTINKETGDVYSLLNNVNEVNYAALDSAINLMAERDSESIMLTDGELFTQTTTHDNPNNPYMHSAFKKWLQKGHDIHIIAEPYQESYRGKVFNKKRFYIIFTDDRIEGNVYDRIKETVDLRDFPSVDEFHLSGNYPWKLPIDGKTSRVNSNVGAEVSSYDNMEVQDWQVDWKHIKNLIANAFDDSGNPLPNGEVLIDSLRINRNAFGTYRITDVEAKVYNINHEFFEIDSLLQQSQKIGRKQYKFKPIDNFIILDKDEFKRHGTVNLYFDIDNFAPDQYLDGDPFNYFKIEIVISGLQDITDNNLGLFKFESIAHPGQTNESISASLRQAAFDQDLKDRLLGSVLYTIYVKSHKYK